MRPYELTVIFRANEEDFTKGKQQVDELLNKTGVTVDSSDDLNVRMLAYPVEKEEKGHYLTYHITAQPEALPQLDKALKLMQPVLKFLVVRKDEEEKQAASKSKKKKEEKGSNQPEAQAE